MEKTFFCVMSEFYDNGTVKTSMFFGDRKVKPADSEVSTPIADCYKDWFETESKAVRFMKDALRESA